MVWAVVKGGPVMIAIILASMLGLAIIIYKVWQLWAGRIDAAAFTDEVVERVGAGDMREAIALCDGRIRYPIARTLKAGLLKRGLPPHEIEKAMERAGNNEVKALEKYIGGLISIVGIEPLLGFLGTITGLIRAFMAWEKAGAGVTVSALASGIYEAMITTAAGLTVAVPYYLICNFIISRVKYISFELGDCSMRLAEALVEERSGAKV